MGTSGDKERQGAADSEISYDRPDRIADDRKGVGRTQAFDRVSWVQPSYSEGREWDTPDRFTVERVVAVLDALHGGADLGNRQDPVEELVWISLTRQTHRPNAVRSWQQIVELGGPAALLELSEERLATELAHAGFSRQKARWIKSSLHKVVERFGRLSLADTDDWPNDEIEHFLISLPGIAVKSARCVMMYSLGRRVLPVDTHLRRLTERLGWVPAKLNERAIHQQLEALVPPEHRYSLHVNAIWHGRGICRALGPRCDGCVINTDCRHAAMQAVDALI